MHPHAPLGAGDGLTRMHRDAGAPSGFDQVLGRVRSRIDDADDGDSGVVQIECRQVGAVVVGGDDGARAEPDAIAMEPGAGRTGEHDAGTVVMRENQGPLDGAGGDDHVAGAHLPQTFSRGVGVRVGEVVGDAFHQGDQIVRIPAERGGARQQGHGGRKGGNGLRHPGSGGPLIDGGVGFGQQGAAEFRLLVAQNHTRSGGHRPQRGGEAGGTGADHQHVAMGVLVQIAVGIGLRRRSAQASGGADCGLIQALPKGRRPHEGLVVEAGGQQRRCPAGRGAQVEFQRRVAVLAGGAQPVIQLDLGGAQVRCDPPAAPIDGDQSVRFLRPGGEDAARTVILERPADQVDIVRQQGGGQGVAREPGQRPPIEGEAERLVAVDATGVMRPEGLGHAGGGSLGL